MRVYIHQIINNYQTVEWGEDRRAYNIRILVPNKSKMSLTFVFLEINFSVKLVLEAIWESFQWFQTWAAF